VSGCASPDLRGALGRTTRVSPWPAVRADVLVRQLAALRRVTARLGRASAQFSKTRVDTLNVVNPCVAAVRRVALSVVTHRKREAAPAIAFRARWCTGPTYTVRHFPAQRFDAPADRLSGKGLLPCT